MAELAIEALALHGGRPQREALLSYGRQSIDEDDIRAVVEVLRSEWLTTGPKVEQFEEALSAATGAREAVVVSSGTAALHAAMHALGIGPGDEVIVPPMTFAASANAVVYQGGTPVFADVDPATLLLDPAAVEAKITDRTRAIVAVDYAGQPCDYAALRAVTEPRGIAIVADACHSLGGADRGRPVGSLADLSVFSFHPVKPIATGEGGAITTDDPALAQRMRVFRNHGIATDHRQRAKRVDFFYQMVELGYNYRLTDIQCALGISQLRKLAGWVERRREIADRYAAAFAGLAFLQPLAARPSCQHAYHLYVVQLQLERLSADRAQCFRVLRAEGIGVNVHYVPVHLHPFYRERFDTGPGLCPKAEEGYDRILSLPIFPAMTTRDVQDVIAAVGKLGDALSR